MELVLIVEQQMTQFMSNGEVLPNRCVMRVHANDFLIGVAEKKARQVAFERINGYSRPFCPCDFPDGNGGFRDLGVPEERFHQFADLPSSHGHDFPFRVF